MNRLIDHLTYRSWLYQITWYGVDKIQARKIYSDWEAYEKKYENEKFEKFLIPKDFKEEVEETMCKKKNTCNL